MARGEDEEIMGPVAYAPAGGAPTLLRGDALFTSEPRAATLGSFAPSIMAGDMADLRVAADVYPTGVGEQRTVGNGSTQPPAPQDAFDEAKLREYIGNDNAVIVKVLRSFLVNTPDHLKAISAALSSGDRRKIASLAHSLKGSMSFIAAAAAVAAARELERIANSGDVQAIADAGAALRSEILRLTAALGPFLARTLRSTQP